MKVSTLAQALGYHAADKRMEVLRRIEETGSISQAARLAGISYKAAWQAVDTLSNLTGMKLVDRSVGGVGGGGARLTGEGRRLLEIAARLEAQRQQFFASLAREEGVFPEEGLLPLGVQTSMRNHLLCRVASLETAGPVVRVGLALRDTMMLASRITRTSAELLALRPGLPVIALCKAMAVKVGRECLNEAAGANCLKGKVSRLARGEEADELFLELDYGLQLVGFSPSSLRIEEGEQVWAMIDESAVALALFP
ncbi:MAG: TOBE domain-containing protein [Alistipes senegalensis]|nr:TOBE domain-containing protein [Oxalobacter formigenes]MCM1281763.1 TOBE domain-containing protein [Alistipes senegalensis]